MANQHHNTPTDLTAGFWRVETDEFAPYIRRGDCVRLDDVPPDEGDIVAVRAENPPGFKLAPWAPGMDHLATVVQVSRQYK
ncbi:hypothetical protein [Methylocaldum szegediense]|jgi:hypothetical protein|uniref:Uncharacterized protein n=1 Tax=Methylocaldum szegediense TaxID=73780 RepID=A0ABM9HX93_9GAMM|nr:hypothetical protein [Methylocaldum szegediense]CAI8748541.1 protein of unknown function [Methylocaldum szegediense]